MTSSPWRIRYDITSVTSPTWRTTTNPTCKGTNGEAPALNEDWDFSGVGKWFRESLAPSLRLPLVGSFPVFGCDEWWPLTKCCGDCRRGGIWTGTCPGKGPLGKGPATTPAKRPLPLETWEACCWGENKIKGLCEQTREWLQIKNVNQFACRLNRNTAPTFNVKVIESSRDRTEYATILGLRVDFHPGVLISVCHPGMFIGDFFFPAHQLMQSYWAGALHCFRAGAARSASEPQTTDLGHSSHSLRLEKSRGCMEWMSKCRTRPSELVSGWVS